MRIPIVRIGLRSRKLFAVLVIAVVFMASMVVILRGKGRQATIADASSLNSLQSAFYIRHNNTIWEDSLNDSSQWHITYSQPNMTAQIVANGELNLDADIASALYPQAVNIYRQVNLSLTRGPVLLIALESSQGIHYGIRMSGLDGSGNTFQAWSESSYLQHRSGLGQSENFTINALLEAYAVNGIFPATGSRITGLTFYIEATPGQVGQFSLNVYRLTVKETNQYSFNPTDEVAGQSDGIALVVNATNSLGYTDNRFAQGYIDYYVSGTPDLHYTVYYTHGLIVVGQGYFYTANKMTYNIATFSASNVVSYPPIFMGNNTYSIILAPTSGSFFTFQLDGFSIRYLSQAPLTTTPNKIDASAVIAYYLIFLFVTPVAIVILITKLSNHEVNQAS